MRFYAKCSPLFWKKFPSVRNTQNMRRFATRWQVAFYVFKAPKTPPEKHEKSPWKCHFWAPKGQLLQCESSTFATQKFNFQNQEVQKRVRERKHFTKRTPEFHFSNVKLFHLFSLHFNICHNRIFIQKLPFRQPSQATPPPLSFPSGQLSLERKTNDRRRGAHRTFSFIKRTLLKIFFDKMAVNQFIFSKFAPQY